MDIEQQMDDYAKALAEFRCTQGLHCGMSGSSGLAVSPKNFTHGAKDAHTASGKSQMLEESR